MRALIAGRAFPVGLVLAAGTALVQVLLAGWVFGRVYRYATRVGLLARYSAEGVS